MTPPLYKTMLFLRQQRILVKVLLDLIRQCIYRQLNLSILSVSPEKFSSIHVISCLLHSGTSLLAQERDKSPGQDFHCFQSISLATQRRDLQEVPERVLRSLTGPMRIVERGC